MQHGNRTARARSDVTSGKVRRLKAQRMMERENESYVVVERLIEKGLLQVMRGMLAR